MKVRVSSGMVVIVLEVTVDVVMVAEDVVVEDVRVVVVEVTEVRVTEVADVSVVEVSVRVVVDDVTVDEVDVTVVVGTVVGAIPEAIMHGRRYSEGRRLERRCGDDGIAQFRHESGIAVLHVWSAESFVMNRRQVAVASVHGTMASW